MQERALLIEADYETGRRAAEINPRDENLQCYGWQNLPEHDGPDVEIRLVEDDRELGRYQRARGVRVLTGLQEINDAIRKYIPDGEEKTIHRRTEDEWGSELGDGNGLPE